MSKTAWFDCPAGIAGDMALAALIHAGASLEAVTRAVDGVCGLKTGLAVTTDVDSPISGLMLLQNLPNEHSHRTLADILTMIEAATGQSLTTRAADTATVVFKRLAAAEAEVHGCPIEEVHFHELGALDSIVDIVGVAAALDDLDVDVVTASPLPMTRGTVMTMHGPLPVPAPATIELLRGYEVYGLEVEGEFVTPTGAVLCAALAGKAGPMPGMTISSTGYGFGHRKWPDGRPNCVRVVLGEPAAEMTALDQHVKQISANIDDSTPDDIARLAERLMESGALDAWITPIQMKKGRPGWKVSALARADACKRLAEVFFTESSTIGVRITDHARITLDRSVETLSTGFGPVRVKTARLAGVIVNVQAESDDLHAIADRTGIPLKEVRRKISDCLK